MICSFLHEMWFCYMVQLSDQDVSEPVTTEVVVIAFGEEGLQSVCGRLQENISGEDVPAQKREKHRRSSNRVQGFSLVGFVRKMAQIVLADDRRLLIAD